MDCFGGSPSACLTETAVYTLQCQLCLLTYFLIFFLFVSSFTILKVKALKVQIVRHRQDISSCNTLTAAIFMETPSVSKISSVRIKTTNTGSVDDTNSGRVRKPNPPMVCDNI